MEGNGLKDVLPPGDVLRKLDCAQNTKTPESKVRVLITYIDSINIHQSTMPSNRASNDIDFIPPLASSY
jgi:hypothetical protein